MDEPFVNKMRRWFLEDLKVDGWVARDDNGHLYVELFPKAIYDLKLKEGDYVRLQVIHEDETTPKSAGTKSDIPRSFFDRFNPRRS